jgi:hypothetical protein
MSHISSPFHKVISHSGLFLERNLDKDGMHKDMHVMDIDSKTEKPKEKRNATADIKQFFKPMPHVPGDKSGRSRCESCQ